MKTFRQNNKEGAGEEIDSNEFALQNGTADLLFTILHSLFAWFLLLLIEFVNVRFSLIKK